MLQAQSEPTPIAGRTLALEPALFAADAVILPDPASRSVRYTAPGAPAIEVAWEGFRQLGIWSRDGGDFLCIEPWHGTASPADFDGEFRDKPGLMLIPPGERRTLSMRIRLVLIPCEGKSGLPDPGCALPSASRSSISSSDISANVFPLAAADLLHRAEPLVELEIGLLQAGLGIQIELARQIGEHKQQIADLVRQPLRPRIG